MSLTVPAGMETVIQEADANVAPLDEGALAGALSSARPASDKVSPEENAGAFAEIAAWRLSRARGTDDLEPWGIYWGPMASGTLADGKTPFYRPDVAEIDESILTHWIQRATNTKHPVLKARYADLAWEIGRYLKKPAKSRPACPKAPISLEIPFSLATVATDGYLDAVTGGLAEDEHHAWVFLDRAIGLALSLKDAGRTARAKAALFAFYRKVSRSGGKFLWWRPSDLTERHGKGLNLDAAEQEEILQSLESALRVHSNISDKERFDPHAATNAADRLAAHFGNKRDEAQRVMKLAGSVFEEAAKQASGLLAISWLEDVLSRYRSVGLIEDVARVEQAIRDRAEQARGEMKRVSVPVDIPQKEVDEWVESVVGEDAKQALGRIAIFCLSREVNAQKSVQGMMEHAPLLSQLTATVMGTEGFTEATIDSIEDDLQGRTVQHAADRFSWHAPLLHMVFARAKNKFSLDLEAFMAHIKEAPFFAASREALLREGFAAWFAGDPVKTIHVLVPQLEAACRDLLAAVGAPVMRHDPKTRGYEVIGMGAVIHHAAFRQGVDKDIRFHLNVLYSDPRGINLRNHLAHGTAHVGILGMGMANWVVHSLLLIANLRLRQRAAQGEPASGDPKGDGPTEPQPPGHGADANGSDAEMGRA